jgi:(1->4)-alpha-D-glucan 1-alpha-D-glucosylmutase
MYLIYKTLDLRRRRSQAFEPGSPYEPLTVEGSGSHHVLAFLRANEIAVIVPRLPRRGAAGGWADASVLLPGGRWRNELTDEEITDERVAASDLFATFPVALLVRS